MILAMLAIAFTERATIAATIPAAAAWINHRASLSMVADDLTLAAAGALFSEGISQEERDMQLKVRMPNLSIARTRVATSSIPDAGMGLFATRDIAVGELVTMYPGDALAMWTPEDGMTLGSGQSIREAFIAVDRPLDSEWAIKWKAQDEAFISQAMGYAVRTGPHRAIIGDPAQRSDAAYLGHMANDAAMCTQPGTATLFYASASEAASNVGLETKGLKGCHHAVVATKPIASGAEIFLSYGQSYWLSRLPEPPKRYPFADGSEYFGEVAGGQIQGHGQYTDAEGNLYVGEFANGSFEGIGTLFYIDGHAEVCRYQAGEAVGVGVGWSKDRTEAYRVVMGAGGGIARTEVLGLEDASELAGSLGVPVPTRKLKA